MQTATPLRSRIEAFGYGSGRGERENVLETTTLNFLLLLMTFLSAGSDLTYGSLNLTKKNFKNEEQRVVCVCWMFHTPAHVMDFTNQIIITT